MTFCALSKDNGTVFLSVIIPAYNEEKVDLFENDN